MYLHEPMGFCVELLAELSSLSRGVSARPAATNCDSTMCVHPIPCCSGDLGKEEVRGYVATTEDSIARGGAGGG